MIDISDKLKRYGFKGFLLNAFCKSLKLVGIKLELISIFSLELTYENEKLIEGYNEKLKSFHPLTLDDFQKQAILNSDWFSEAKLQDIRKAFSISGNYVYGLLDGELITCYAWVSLKKWGLEEQILLPDDGYLWDTYTHPQHRGKGLHFLLLLLREKLLTDYKKKRALSQIAIYNRASRVGFERAGFKRMEIYCIYSFGRNAEKTTCKYGKDNL